MSNNLDRVLNVSSISTSGPEYTQTNTCGNAVPARSKCTVAVTFTPALIGARNFQLAVTDDSTTSPHVAYLSGTGV